MLRRRLRALPEATRSPPNAAPSPLTHISVKRDAQHGYDHHLHASPLSDKLIYKSNATFRTYVASPLAKPGRSPSL
jgi:hypothetical protein